MRRTIVFLVALCVLAVAVFAQNASNATNTSCDDLCLNGSVQWGNLFVCDFGGTSVACCNNLTACNQQYSNCTSLTYIAPQLNLPGGNPGNGSGNGQNNNGGNNGSVNPQSVVDFSSSVSGGSRRVMRLYVNGDTAGEPIFVSANNVFGPMKGVELRFYRDGRVVQTVETDGETEVVLEEPGRYVLEASRSGYLTASTRIYLYASDPGSDVEIDADGSMLSEPAEEQVEEQPEPEEEYSPITSLATVSSPKENLNLARFLVLLLAVAALAVYAVRRFRPPKEPDEGLWSNTPFGKE